ncbi:MAG: hypothetical protein EXR76_06830 [Myxococcales bacterium]|nr:hypothetical protein [Myxococcales bacterium]
MKTRDLGLSLLLLSCADTPDPSQGAGLKDPSAPILTGKADGHNGPLESGRLTNGERVTVDLSDRTLAFRLTSYGQTQVRLSLTATAGAVDPYLILEGPLPSHEGRVVAFHDDVGEKDRSSSLVATLIEPGAYRVHATTYALTQDEPSVAGKVTLSYVCEAACEAKTMSLGELIVALRADVGDATLRSLLESTVSTFFTDSETQAGVISQLDGLLGGTPLEGFPVVALSAIGTAQALLERPEAPVEAPAAETFVLDELLRERCSPQRSTLAPLHPSVPMLQTGSAPDYSIDDCRLQRAQDLARVLNNLALENGSEVIARVGAAETSFTTVEGVFQALIAAGHRVVVTNDRFFADFLGLSYRGVSVAAPVWLDTGLATTDGGTLSLPAPHSHHTIRIKGPLVDATLMFYLGVSGGVSFRAVAGERPTWTGGRTLYTYDSDADPDTVLTLMVTAARLRKRWAEEGRGLPAEGYGQLGVCNDSTAVMEYAVEGTVTLFPLAHAAVESPEGDADEITRILAALPSDLEGFDPVDASRRLRLTLPFEDLASLPFAGLRAAMLTLP